MKKQTLAQFKRELANGEIIGLELIERKGEKIANPVVAPIKKVNSNSIILQRGDKESYLWYPPASLFEYNFDFIKIYEKGSRDLNKIEQDVLNAWAKIESQPDFQEQARVDMLTDGSTTYWRKKRFFEQSPAPYLFSSSNKYNLRYDRTTNKIYDPKIKGECILVYYVHRA